MQETLSFGTYNTVEVHRCFIDGMLAIKNHLLQQATRGYIIWVCWGGPQWIHFGILLWKQQNGTWERMHLTVHLPQNVLCWCMWRNSSFLVVKLRFIKRAVKKEAWRQGSCALVVEPVVCPQSIFNWMILLCLANRGERSQSGVPHCLTECNLWMGEY